MRELTRGQRLKLADLVDLTSPFTIRVQATAPFAVDCACFGLDAHGRLSGDPYLIFYNQLATPCSGVQLSLSSHTAHFLIHLDALSATIERLVLTATVDGVGDMSGLQHGSVDVYQHNVRRGCAELHGRDFQGEKALLLTEVYRKDGVWRCAVLGTGFHGGLSALLRHFGGEEAPPVSVPPTPTVSVSLGKAARLEKELCQTAPQLVSLVKAAHARLDRHGLSGHVAKVCLVLDVSGSMIGLYRRGVVQQIAERLLALACLFDDDQAIDVFLFDSRAIAAGSISIANVEGAVDRLISTHKLGGGTDYAPVMGLVRRTCAEARSGLPAYVLFVTDGAPGDRSASQKTLRDASHEAIFWQFVGVGSSRFDFLEKLDDLKGRLIDNADFFAIADLSKTSDAEIYRLLLQEYPGWLQAARAHGLLN